MSETVTAITGISGLVGGNLARTLVKQGRLVRGLIHRDRRAIQGLPVECVPGDVLDVDSLHRLFSGAVLVYHLAAHISLETADSKAIEAVNVVGTRNVVNACLACGVRRLVHLSSIHALERPPLDRPVDESAPRALSPGHLPYDRSKAAGELEVRRGIEAGLDAVILNPTAIIGPFDFKPSYFGRALLSLAHGELPALVRGGFDWIDVRDVVAAVCQAERHAQPGSSYVLAGSWRSVRDVAAQVALLTGQPAPRLVVPLWIASAGLPFINLFARIRKREPLYTRVSLAALRDHWRIDDTLARRELNHKPRPFQDTIADTVDWFAGNGYLRTLVDQSRGV